MDKKQIRTLIAQYDHAYYNLDAPLISDTEYDALKALLNDEETKVPGNALFNKVKHTAPMLSLDKVKITDQEALRSHLERLWPVCIEPKLDGLTLVIYPDGTCLTRGDGYIGEDVSINCRFQKGVSIAYPIRGEVVITKENFERLNAFKIANEEEPFKNARNAAAGLLRQKEAKYLEFLNFITYEIVGLESLAPNAQITDLNEAYYWQTVDCYVPYTIEEAITYINTYDKNSYCCDIDGLVIKHIGDKKFGTTAHHPSNAMAIKWASDEKWTKLLKIDYQVGRTGKITPIAEFEPIDLMGSIVSKATLHNMAYINALELNINPFRKEVCVTKANDIIPAVIGARVLPEYAMFRDIKYLIAPTHCPECGIALEQVNDQLFCRNKYCKEKVIAKAMHMASRQGLDINGLSEETLRKMSDLFTNQQLIYTYPFYLKYEHILGLEGFAKKSAQKLYEAIEKAKQNVSMSQFLIACGVPLMGKSACKAIAKRFRNLEELMQDVAHNGPILNTIEGIGKELIESLQQNWDAITMLLAVIDETHIVSEYQETKAPQKQLTFVITGKFDKPRSYYEQLITNAGHKLAGSVSSKTDYLIIQDCQSISSKAVKARALGIALIDEEALIHLLQEK